MFVVVARAARSAGVPNRAPRVVAARSDRYAAGAARAARGDLQPAGPGDPGVQVAQAFPDVGGVADHVTIRSG